MPRARVEQARVVAKVRVLEQGQVLSVQGRVVLGEQGVRAALAAQLDLLGPDSCPAAIGAGGALDAARAGPWAGARAPWGCALAAAHARKRQAAERAPQRPPRPPSSLTSPMQPSPSLSSSELLSGSSLPCPSPASSPQLRPPSLASPSLAGTGARARTARAPSLRTSTLRPTSPAPAGGARAAQGRRGLEGNGCASAAARAVPRRASAARALDAARARKGDRQNLECERDVGSPCCALDSAGEG